jgi:nicotinamide mononucleotide (NMN) deamidase PncC
MTISTEQLAARIHDTPTTCVLAVSGGGSRAISELLCVPGASRTVLEAIVPYSDAALAHWLGGRPDQFCAARTARAMAVVAFHRARRLAGADAGVVGVAATAGLATDRPRRGSHRAHVAWQSAAATAAWSLELQKGRRSRAEEEELVGRLLLNAVAEGCGLSERLELALVEGEQIEPLRVEAPPDWQDLFLGRTEAIGRGPCEQPVRALLPGAFNPLHIGHCRMIGFAAEMLQAPVAVEISIINVDKPPLDFYEISRRVAQFPPEQAVWLSRAETFEQKSRLFPGATFLVGADTLRRIASPVYYGGEAACRAALEGIVERGCRFLVFGRDLGTGFMRLPDLDLPDVLRGVCREVPAEVFREDVSSTALRREGKW